jgi:hypothetical protein
VDYTSLLNTFVITIFGSLVGVGLGVFIVKRFVEKGIQHGFDRNLEKFKDELKRVSDSKLEGAKNQFVIGATSHMANAVFDKHVEFCEAYVLEMQVALACLVLRGLKAEPGKNADQLRDIRLKARVWLPQSISDRLVFYEQALRWIATHNRQQKDYGELPGWRERPQYQKEVDRIFDLYTEIIDEGQKPEEALRPSVGTSVVIEEIKKVLGIEELTRLRGELIRRASLD